MFRDNLKNLRKAKGLSQEELARRMNVVRQTVSKWEKGSSLPDANMLVDLANILDTPINELIGDNMTTTGGKEPMQYDVIIIGAGSGGIFAAYELIQRKPELKVAVFEAGHYMSM